MPTLYDYKVVIEGASGFILDTSLLDTGLLGYLTTEVTSYVRNVRVRRGKSTNLDEFTAGQMTVTFDNRDRAFDPNYTSSPLYGAIVPRRKIQFFIQDKQPGFGFRPQFWGYVDDWSFEYDVNGDSIAVASCSDAFTLFANQNITVTTPPGELAGDRLQRVLQSSDVLFENTLDQEGAAFTMDSVTYTGAALSYLQSVAGSERGYFFINQFGFAQYLGWNYFAQGIDSPLTFTDQQIDMGAAGTVGIPFTSVQNVYGTEQLYNFVTVAGAAGTVTAQNTTSQTDYGITDGSFTVITAGTAEMQVLANYVISNYKDPRFRVSEVTVSLDDQRVRDSNGYLGLDDVLSYDIGGRVRVLWTPNQIGTAISLTGFVIGKSVDASPGECTISFSISSNESRSIYP